jgi:hypothetical protein
MIEIIQISLIAFMFVRMGEPGMVFAWYQRLIGGLPEWLRFPLGYCEKCFGGQSLFWAYLILHYKDYNLIEHLFYPSMGIFLIVIYGFVYDKLTE